MPDKCCFTPIDLSKQNFHSLKGQFPSIDAINELLANIGSLSPVLFLASEVCCCVLAQERLINLWVFSAAIDCLWEAYTLCFQTLRPFLYLLPTYCRRLAASLKHMTLKKKWTSCFCADHMKKINDSVKLLLLVIIATPHYWTACGALLVQKINSQISKLLKSLII